MILLNWLEVLLKHIAVEILLKAERWAKIIALICVVNTIMLRVWIPTDEGRTRLWAILFVLGSN